MSQRHIVVDEDDRVLDAARACVLDVGVRRTTMTDVARRAGVSRMTLYRRFPDLDGERAPRQWKRSLVLRGPTALRLRW